MDKGLLEPPFFLREANIMIAKTKRTNTLKRGIINSLRIIKVAFSLIVLSFGSDKSQANRITFMLSFNCSPYAEC